MDTQSTSLGLFGVLNRSLVRHRWGIVISSSCKHCFGSHSRVIQCLFTSVFCLSLFYFIFPNFLKSLFVIIPVSCLVLGVSVRRHMTIIEFYSSSCMFSLVCTRPGSPWFKKAFLLWLCRSGCGGVSKEI